MIDIKRRYVQDEIKKVEEVLKMYGRMDRTAINEVINMGYVYRDLGTGNRLRFEK